MCKSLSVVQPPDQFRFGSSNLTKSIISIDNGCRLVASTELTTIRLICGVWGSACHIKGAKRTRRRQRIELRQGGVPKCANPRRMSARTDDNRTNTRRTEQKRLLSFLMSKAAAELIGTANTLTTNKSVEKAVGEEIVFFADGLNVSMKVGKSLWRSRILSCRTLRAPARTLSP